MPFSRELYIERDDFLEDPPKKFFRLAPGREVRLRYAYFVTCTGVVKDDDGRGRRAALHLRPGDPRRPAPDGRKVKGTLTGSRPPTPSTAEVRLYDRLFTQPEPRRRRGGPRLHGRPEPRRRWRFCRAARSSPAWPAPVAGDRFQFERQGYFCVDPDSGPGRPVFNRTVTLRDTWAKIEKKEEA